MATRTVSQTGPLSDAATFGGSAFSDGDTIQNPASNGFTLTIDVDATVAGMGSSGAGNGNGTTVVNSGVRVTLTADVIQGDATWTQNAGSSFRFDTTGGDVRFRFGDAASFSTYANCTFVCNGSANGGDTAGRPTATTGGNHVTVDVTGGNHGYFDDFSAGAGDNSNKVGYDLHYGDFTGVTNSAGTVGLPMCDFGARDYRAEYCMFDGCGPVWKARPFEWSSAANKDFYFRYCRVTNQTGAASGVAFYGDEAGSGVTEIHHNYFGGPTENRTSIALTYNVWAASYNHLQGVPAAFTNNLYRRNGTDEQCLQPAGARYCYFLGGTDAASNQHALNISLDDTIVEYNVFDYTTFQGGGESVYIGGGGGDGSIIRFNINLPSADGESIGANANQAAADGSALWAVEHNTNYGTGASSPGPHAAASESPATGGPQYSSVKSNLIVDPSGSTARAVCDFEANHNDAVDGDDATHNGFFGRNGDGYDGTYTNAPGANDVVADPQFVDPTRDFEHWTVYKGYASSGDSITTKYAAGMAALASDPGLIDDLRDWVRAGFAPTNVVFKDAGHDGVTIGAVEWVGTGNRRRRVLLCGGGK